MQNEFVPYTEALALKELGFDEPCFYRYNHHGTAEPDIKRDGKLVNNRKWEKFGDYDDCVGAPLYQQAFRFFREKYNLQHEIYYLDDLIKNGYKVTDTSTNTELTEFQYKHNYFELGGYDFEEAELECLKQLIKIVKNQTKN